MNSRITGPTPLPDPVLTAVRQQMVSHRSDQFKSVYQRVSIGLQSLLDCNLPPLLFTCSGTGALEASITNTLRPDDKVLAFTAGHYGDLFASIARHYLCSHVDIVKVEPGYGVTPALVESSLAGRAYDAVLFTHNESSTACLHPIEDLAATVKRNSDALVLVDAVSSVGTTPLSMDKWGIDIAVTVPQKGLMSPPGMGIIGLSEKALDKSVNGQCFGSPAFDFIKCLKQAEKHQTLTTPAMQAFWGLDAALQMIEKETHVAVFERHRQLAALMRKGVLDAGFGLLTESSCYSPGVTAVLVPENTDSKSVMDQLANDFSIYTAQGVGALQDKVLRIAHMGYVSMSEIIAVNQALLKISGDIGRHTID